jgi:Fe-S-cluster containining protein
LNKIIDTPGAQGQAGFLLQVLRSPIGNTVMQKELKIGNHTGIHCLRCGNCCHVDMMAYVTETDLRRWEKEGRRDIMARAQGDDIIWSGDRMVTATGKKLKNCIYLGRDGATFFCEIYETRPLVCQNYIPGSSELCPSCPKKK